MRIKSNAISVKRVTPDAFREPRESLLKETITGFKYELTSLVRWRLAVRWFADATVPMVMLAIGGNEGGTIREAVTFSFALLVVQTLRVGELLYIS